MKRNVSVVRFIFHCNIHISGKIIKEMPGSVERGTRYISNKGLLQQCVKQQNVAVTVLLPLPLTKEYRKTFCPVSRIGPVTARPAPNDKYPVNNSHCSDLCKNVSFAVLLFDSNDISYTVLYAADVCVCVCVCVCARAHTHVLHSRETMVGQNK